MSLLAAVFVALVTPVHPGPILTDVPANPDPGARYVFYVHGRIMESQGREAVSPDFGPYEYDAILKALAAKGSTVVSEVRKGEMGQAFVDKLAGQIRLLRKAGVPSRNIGVVGASRGGALTLMVSSAVADPEISYVVLAGCGGGSVERAPTLRGRILSIYDDPDRFNPSCGETFARASGLTESREMALKLGLDHGLLYKAHAGWVQPAAEWLLR